MKAYVLAKAEWNGTWHGKPDIVGCYGNRATAEAVVVQEIEDYVDDRAGKALTCDFEAMSAIAADGSYGCTWSITETEVEGD